MKRLLIPAVVAALTVMQSACSDRPLLGPDDPAPVNLDAHLFGFGERCDAATFMTRNMYVGADVDAVVDALTTPSTDDDVAALVTAIQTFVLTDFPARAAAMAGEIKRGLPDIVGLQEVSVVHVSLPAIPELGIEEPVEIYSDFLPTLLSELDDRNLDYVAAVINDNIVVDLPIVVEGQQIGLIHLEDKDAILVNDGRVTVNWTDNGLFEARIPPEELPPGISITRGWVEVNATACGVAYTVLSTHLESGHRPDGALTGLRYLQAVELVTQLGTANPAVVLGDLNDWPDTPMYQVLAGAGFTDTWDALRPWSRGYTCCHQPALYNIFAQFDERIDYVWTRGFGAPRGLIYRTGWLPYERVPGPLYKIWPSDHAGLVAKLRKPMAAALVAP